MRSYGGVVQLNCSVECVFDLRINFKYTHKNSNSAVLLEKEADEDEENQSIVYLIPDAF